MQFTYCSLHILLNCYETSTTQSSLSVKNTSKGFVDFYQDYDDVRGSCYCYLNEAVYDSGNNSVSFVSKLHDLSFDTDAFLRKH